MSHALFRPIAGRSNEIMDFLMHTEEVSAYPSLAYTFRLACEEIIVNIISYAYPVGVEGYIRIDVIETQGELCIEIEDGGIPFNPVEKEEPDITLKLEEREIGGLGIFLVLRLMDVVEYRREGGQNKLVLKKNTKTADGNE